MEEKKIPFHEFFARSGLVSNGLSRHFEASWANDISEKKMAVYVANLGGEAFHLGDVSKVKGVELPGAKLSWASFPCQDLSLAGKIGGIHSERSGLVWQWLRIIDEMGDAAPRVVCLENVVGLVSSRGGDDYRALHEALASRGYKCGAMLVNAELFVPQSRPRVFVVATKGDVPAGLASDAPSWLHSRQIATLGESIDGFVWWSAERPGHAPSTLMASSRMRRSTRTGPSRSSRRRTSRSSSRPVATTRPGTGGRGTGSPSWSFAATAWPVVSGRPPAARQSNTSSIARATLSRPGF